MSTSTSQHAQVTVDGAPVTLSFHGDLTPVEAVAVFLRDIADCSLHGTDLLLDLAKQLDPAIAATGQVQAR